MRHLHFIVGVLLLASCASQYRRDVISAPSSKLERHKSVVVATPKNGFYDNREYRSSGRETAAVVQSAFSRFASNVVVNAKCSEIGCLKSETSNYDYLVIPEILHWEDRNTEWSGKPDRVEVKLTVWDNLSGKELSSVIISGKSKWATLGGDHPQDLLPEPIGQYVQTLY